MSTAGKVLAVLCTIVLAVWAILIASVDQLNINNNAKIDKLKADIVKTKTELDEVSHKADETLSKVNEEQVARERDMRIVLTRVSTAERQLTSTREALSRVQIELENYKTALATAKLGLESRIAEKARYEKEKADEEAMVKRLQGENADLTGELLTLRTDFVKQLRENTEKVEQRLKSPGAYTRRASLIKP